jgi:hypothetical protein
MPVQVLVTFTYRTCRNIYTIRHHNFIASLQHTQAILGAMPSRGSRTKVQRIQGCWQAQQLQVAQQGRRVQQQVLQVLLLPLVSCLAASQCSCREGFQAWAYQVGGVLPCKRREAL